MNKSAKKISLRVSLSIIAVAALLSGCGIVERHIDLEMELTQNSPSAIVMGSSDTTNNDRYYGYSIRFARYDQNTKRLIPGASHFTITEIPAHRGLTVKKIEPGDYIATIHTTLRGLGIMDLGFFNSPDVTAFSGVADDARIEGIEAFRISFAPGEVVYLGEYVISTFKPEWADRRKDVRAQLTKMPNITVQPVFRPPVLRAE